MTENIDINIYNLLTKDPLSLISDLMGMFTSLFSVSIFGSKTYVAKTSEEHECVFKTMNKDSNSIAVFERVSPGSVFNQQENTWREKRDAHPCMLVDGNRYIDTVRRITLTHFSNNTYDLQNDFHRLTYAITSAITFGNVDWDGYEYFNHQSPSVNRQLTYSIPPISPWFYYGRSKWFELIEKMIANADNDAVASLIPEPKVGEMSAMFWGGMFSLTNIITTAIYYIGKHPEYKECDIELIIKESLRICNGAPLLTRTLNKDLPIGVKSGDNVMICPYALHRDSKYWENPKIFNPKRHTIDNNYCSRGFMPFGHDSGRACVARDYALMISKTVVKTIINNYVIEIQTNKEYEIEPYCGATRLKHKYPIKLQRYHREQTFIS